MKYKEERALPRKTKREVKKEYVEKKAETEDIVDTLKENYMPYAMSVIVSRAIPQIDGFKPSHRKLLYTMYKMGLIKGNRKKSATIVGETMKLNPHSDMAIYETMVKLARGNESLLHPYVDSKGNFGKQSSRDMQFAAPRYTEAKLMPLCNELFSEIDMDTVDLVDNYDSTMKEPTLLPTTFPNILVKSNKGIAVGMASSIPSFNLGEVCNYTVEKIKKKKVELFDFIPGPDFPSGGELLFDKKEMEEIYRTGRGSFKLRGRYRYLKKENLIEIYEIPYTATVESVIEKIIEMMKQGRLKEVVDIRDESDLGGLKIALDVRKTVDVEKTMAKLFRYTPLEDSYSCNFNVLCNHTPKVMGIDEILDEWISFRRTCILRKTAYQIDKKLHRLFLLRGLEKILLDIDAAIRIIRDTEKEKDVLKNLMENFGIDEVQGEYILEIKLRNLNKEYILNKIEETQTLEKEVSDLKELYTDEALQDKLMIKELKRVGKQYAQERKTEISKKEEVIVHVEDTKIESYPVTVFLTEHGYLKKIPDTSLRAYSEQKLKDDDRMFMSLEANNDDTLLLLSDKHKMYQLRISDMEDTKASAFGVFLQNYLELSADEHIIYMQHPKDYRGHFVFVFENGKFAKIPLSSYQTKGYRKKLVGAYSDKSPLVEALFMEEEEEILIKTALDKVLLVPMQNINPILNRGSQGIQVARLSKKDRVVSARLADEEEKENFSFARTKKIPIAPKAMRNDVQTQISFTEKL